MTTSQQKKVKHPPSAFVIKAKKFGNSTLNVTRKVAGNRYFGSVMEGFMFVMPVIIVSSIFMLMSEIAPAFGYKAKDADGNVINQAFLDYQKFCMWAYNFSYGIIGMLVAIGISTKLMEKLNSDLPIEKRVNIVAVGIAAVIAYFTISTGKEMWGLIYNDNNEPKGFADIFSNIVGVKGMFPAILVSFIVPNIYKYCYKFNVTIRLPKQVPGTISQSFLNIFPLLFTLFIFAPVGFLFAFLTGDSFLNAFFNWLSPALKGANSAGFMLGYTALYSFVWFIGIHPSVLSAIHEPLKNLGLAENQDAVKAGLHATNAWADSLWMGITQPGGTGATIAIPLLIILFAKSKQLKAIGWTALVPVLFQVNEPVLFGMPLVLNPIMFFPFIAIPVITNALGLLWINVFGMNGANVALPWSMPQIISVPLSIGLDWKAFLLVIAIFFTSFVCWFPFVKIQDRIYLKSELENTSLFFDTRNGFKVLYDRLFNKKEHQKIKLQIVEAKKQEKELMDQQESQSMTKVKVEGARKNILVICVGAGSSAMLANSINEGAKKTQQENVLLAKATSIGDYSSMIENMDLIIISPQGRIAQKDIEKAAKQFNVAVYQTERDEYIELTKNNLKAFQTAAKQLGLIQGEEKNEVSSSATV